MSVRPETMQKHASGLAGQTYGVDVNMMGRVDLEIFKHLKIEPFSLFINCNFPMSLHVLFVVGLPLG